KAFQQHNDGQHEAALQTMEAVVRQHPDNPEAWGRRAQLLSLNDKLEEAEQSLDKAFALNPNYAFGHMLRGMFRQQEGELLGALMLFRKAAEAYAPDAAEPLAYIHELIADIELRLNRPVAARAALKRATFLTPGNADLRKAFDSLFGSKSRLPEAARKDYALLPSAGPAEEWKGVIGEASTGRLADARKAFADWTQRHAHDPAGWYNLGLVQAWLGENPAAVEALAGYVERETDESKAGAAWALAEVLRCGHGIEREADYVENRAVMVLSDPRPLVNLLQQWEQGRRLIGMRSDPEQGMLSGLILDEIPALVLSGASSPPARLAAYLLVVGNVLQLWHPNTESLEKVLNETRQRLGPAAGEPQRSIGPVNFGDVVAEALLFPTAPTTELDAEAKMRDHAQQYFESTWIHRPYRGLGGVPPVDAAGSANLRKRLRGVIQFLQDCAAGTAPRLYDFDRLRGKLGLEAATASPSAPAVAPAQTADISPMSAADLSALDTRNLTAGQLDQAFRAAVQLDAAELAARFARSIVERPDAAAKADRWPYFQHLIQHAQSAGDFGTALNLVDEGEKADCESNEGRRRNDYELRRGRLLARSGQGDQAKDVFERLLGRAPDNMQIAGAATEAMLGAKRAKDALTFAEQGLAQARAQNNRDSEGYFLELVDAAKKQGA
ncbi:MAG TPA: tetratricopeptide repeat protein, partial [Gemmataceae bacterium]|nr:tetratricopeptide repeat protein [Gemmataceae bacterium]